MSLTLDFFLRDTNIKAKVIADSINSKGQRITTLEIEYPRFILAELNTHKALEKNSSSSRAIPIMKMIEQIQSNMAVPLYWGKTQSGMQAGDELESSVLDAAKLAWEKSFYEKLGVVSYLHDSCRLHKQTVNRLLEPYQMMKTVITGTDWDNFFNLRIHPDAQPEFCMLAYKMYVAMQESKPTLLLAGDWHLPYVNACYEVDPETCIRTGAMEYYTGQIGTDTLKWLTLEEAQRVSSSCCAQTSYRKSDDSLEKADKVFEMLVGADVLHCYDKDTEVLTVSGFVNWADVTKDTEIADVCINTGVLKGFSKPLEVVSGLHTGRMFSVQTGDANFRVTDGHTILAAVGASTRRKDFRNDLKVLKLNEIYKGREVASFELKMLTTPYLSQSILKPWGKLIGLYVGDGYVTRIGRIGFHFKKHRKCDYLEEVLSELGWDFNKILNSDSTVTYTLKMDVELEDAIKQKCGVGASNKRIGFWDLELYPSIYDGLKNSDGSVKRKTWTFCTTSDQLREDFLDFAPLAGVTVHENRKQDCYKFMVQTVNSVRLNRSDKSGKGIQTEFVENEPVYCATMPSGAMVVRRGGKVLVMGNSSPFGHLATPVQDTKVVYKDLDYVFADSLINLEKSVNISHVTPTWEKGITHINRNGVFCSGNLQGWISYRHLMDNNTCYEFNFEERMKLFEVKFDA